MAIPKLELERKRFLGKLIFLFNDYNEGKVDPDKLFGEFEELIDDYDKRVYTGDISVDKRKRLIILFESMKIHPLTLNGVDNISKELGIGFTMREGWYVDVNDGISITKDRDYNLFIKPEDKNIDF